MNTIHFRYACILTGLLILIGIVSFIPTYELEWKMTHYLFNYEIEFLKRGFIGECLRLLHYPITAANLVILATVVLMFFAIGYIHIFLPLVYVSEQKIGAWLFLMLAFIHSATLQHFIFDFARFDHFLYILLFIGFWRIRKNGASSVLLMLLIALMVLIHEAAFFITAPILLSFWVYSKSDQNQSHTTWLVAIWSIAITFVVSHWGGSTQLTLEEHVSLLKSLYPEELVREMSVHVLHNRGLLENISWAIEMGFVPGRLLLNFILFLFCLLPLFYFFKPFLQKIKFQENSKRRMLLLSSFSPLCLYLLGHDYARWWALSITNFFLALALICYREPVFREQLMNFCYRKRLYLSLLVASSILLGAVGVVVPFSVFFHIYYAFF